MARAAAPRRTSVADGSRHPTPHPARAPFGREQKINCATLRPVEGTAGKFEVDPDLPGTTGDKRKDYASLPLIFHVPGHVLRPVPGAQQWREIVLS